MIFKNIDSLYERMHLKFWIRQILNGLDLPTWSLSTSNAQKGEEIWNNRNSWEKIKDEFALPCSFFIVNPFWTGLRIFKQEFRTLRESKRVSWKGDSRSLYINPTITYFYYYNAQYVHMGQHRVCNLKQKKWSLSTKNYVSTSSFINLFYLFKLPYCLEF